MVASTEALTAWDVLHRQARHRLEYPSEDVVRFLAGVSFEPTYPRREAALDIGCGSGRHSILLRDFGFDVTACDISPDAVRAAKLRSGLGKRVQCAPMTALPFADESFDVALAYGVFFYGTRTDYLAAIDELHRVLRPGGQAFVNLRSDRDWRAPLTGSDGVFRCDGSPEHGMKVTFQCECDIDLLYGAFSSVSWERSEWTRDERGRCNCDLLVTVTK